MCSRRVEKLVELAHRGVCMRGVGAMLGTSISHCTSPKRCVKGTGCLIGAGGLQRRVGACWVGVCEEDLGKVKT